MTSESEGVFDYIQGLPDGFIESLYQPSETNGTASTDSVWACKAVYQSLSGLSKTLIMRTLFSPDSFTLNTLTESMRVEANSFLITSIEELKRYRIIIETSSNSYTMNSHFKQNLIQILQCPEQPWHLAMKVLKPDKTPPAIAMLDIYANLKWENLLRYLVGADMLDDYHILMEAETKSLLSTATTAITEKDISSNPTTTTMNGMSDTQTQKLLSQTSVMKLTPEQLQRLNSLTIKTIRTFLSTIALMTEVPKNTAGMNDYYVNTVKNNELYKSMTTPGYVLRITAKGYEFMLKDRLQQVWIFVKAMLERTTYQKEALSLLFMLSFCEYGRCYPVDSLTKLQKQLLYEMSLVGIIFLRNIKSSRFYPTKMIIQLLSYKPSKITTGGALALSSISSSISSTLPSSVSIRKDFYIIVETNNQVIAYTNNDLDLALLHLFIDIRLRMPNMIYGKLTRERVKTAYKMGITAKQIIEFLTTHAHPMLLSSSSSSSQKGMSIDNQIMNTNTNNTIMNKTNTLEHTVIPQNITDQLLLWEAENYRIHTQDCILFLLGDIRGLTTKHYQDILLYMERLNVLLWKNDVTRMIGVTPNGADMLVTYMEESLGLYPTMR